MTLQTPSGHRFESTASITVAGTVYPIDTLPQAARAALANHIAQTLLAGAFGAEGTICTAQPPLQDFLAVDN